jgi:hypothetical protein
MGSWCPRQCPKPRWTSQKPKDRSAIITSPNLKTSYQILPSSREVNYRRLMNSGPWPSPFAAPGGNAERASGSDKVRSGIPPARTTRPRPPTPNASVSQLLPQRHPHSLRRSQEFAPLVLRLVAALLRGLRFDAAGRALCGGAILILLDHPA